MALRYSAVQVQRPHFSNEKFSGKVAAKFTDSMSGSASRYLYHQMLSRGAKNYGLCSSGQSPGSWTLGPGVPRLASYHCVRCTTDLF